MRLTKDEAMSLILRFAPNHRISSKTLLNKLLASFNLHLIPIDIEFKLNKFGSFSPDVDELSSNDYFEKYAYEYNGTPCIGYRMKPPATELAEKTIRTKLEKILSVGELLAFKKEIQHLSTLSASDISDTEHRKLLVEVEDRDTLLQKVNTLHVDFYDLYQELDKIPEDSIVNITLRALIEYCYYLTKYLRDKRFKRLEEAYDHDAYMLDYYFLHILSRAIPMIKEEMGKKDKDSRVINKYYQFIVNSVKEYPFSLENPDLKKLVPA